MEVVSVSTPVVVGEVLGGPQPTVTPPTFSTDHTPAFQTNHTPTFHQDLPQISYKEDIHERSEDDDDPADESQSHMDTDTHHHSPHSNTPKSLNQSEHQVVEEQSESRDAIEEDSTSETTGGYLHESNDQMDCEDSQAPMYIDDDSSSRIYPDGEHADSIGGNSQSAPSNEPLPESSRRNKRKNFKPRNISVFSLTDSEDNEMINDLENRVDQSCHYPDGFHDEDANSCDGPLDLSEAPLRPSLMPRRLSEMTGLPMDDMTPKRDVDSVMANPRLNALLNRSSSPGHSEDHSDMGDPKEYSDYMRRLLGLYGLQHQIHENSHVPGYPLPPFHPGKLLESLKSGGMIPPTSGNDVGSTSGNGTGEPPTPPHTPQRELGVPDGRPHPNLDPIHQQLQARMLGGGNFSTLLTLAALQEGKGVAGVPLPPTLDAHKSLPTTPTTPTSTAVTPGLAGLSLGSSGSGPPTMVPGGISKPNLDYSRYVKRFSSALECGSQTCRELNHREHFHCLDCNSKIFSKKEEMIRHFKWHKKRDESLQHGFMRYSPTDDCSDRFQACSHNRKQTHYHCLKESCDKVYISTSDVQMHANYHRKDSAIMQEGFQRFRASEDCSQPGCPFVGQRTTHFHCMRNQCTHTFKNKADMEKHKTYHIKDEQLTKDGFKKFLKQDECSYEGCKFSRVVNHIHCIRPDCNYVLHSSGQIFAHKRKHEREAHERAYRKYKLAQTMLGVTGPHPALAPLLHEALRPLPFDGGSTPGGGDMRSDDSSSPLGPMSNHGLQGIPPHNIQRPPGHPFFMGGLAPQYLPDVNHPLSRLLGVNPPIAHPLLTGSSATSSNSTPPASSSSGPASPVDLSVSIGNQDDNEWERFVQWIAPGDPCPNNCDLTGSEHWHCDECEASFRNRDSAKEHGRIHEQQAIVTEDHYSKVSPGEEPRACPPECQVQDQAEHFHCNWDGCGEAVLASGDKPFRRLEHFKMHDYARRLALAGAPGGNHHMGMGAGIASVTSIDAMFKRKRGRPPKNRIIEVWNDYLPVSSCHDSPQAIFTSFKLPKSSPPPPAQPGLLGPGGMIHHPLTPLGHLANLGREVPSPPPGHPGIGPSLSGAATSVINTLPCSPLMATDQVARGNPIMLPIAGPILANPPQMKVELVDGFYEYSEGSMCSDQLCPHLLRRHFHCAHPRCLFVTQATEMLPLHSQDFHENTPIPEGVICIDRNIDCRLSSCQSKKVMKHFHCTRCLVSLPNYQTLENHMDKHHNEEDNKSHSLGPQSPIYLQKRPESPMSSPPTAQPGTSNVLPETPSKSQVLSPPVVKSSGIFYPLSPFPASSQNNPRSAPSSKGEAGALVTAIPPSTRPTSTAAFTLPVTGSLTITAMRRSPGFPPQSFSPDHRDSAMEHSDAEETGDINVSSPQYSRPNPISEGSLSQLLMNSSNEKSNHIAAALAATEWLMPHNQHQQYSPEVSCGRPFCKLKKKEHFHCQICNQAFSEHEKLRPHLLKHLSSNQGTTETLSSNAEGEEESQIENEEEDRKSLVFHSDHSERACSPKSPGNINSTTMPTTPTLTLPNTPHASVSNSQQLHSQFPSPLVYTQASGFPGLPTPFGPHLGMGMFPPTLPRLLPHSSWPSVHPALAAMTHPGLMMGGIRPNGEFNGNHQSPGLSGNLSPNIGGPGLSSPVDNKSHLLPSSLSTSPHLALLGKRLGQDDYNSHENKKIRSNHSIRLLKDEPVPEGYVRYRFNEDCQYPHCGYREHQTHFHCMRKDCGYSFCDKTRFVQHTARHERLDTLMGGDFNQFRANVPCGRPECVYSTMVGQQQNKASHFHCLKCDFVCTDTNKVVAHRRQHQKRDSINAAGFEKFTPSQPCGMQGCNHNQKQTHYHCLKCQYAVLGLSQMSAHRFRHLE